MRVEKALGGVLLLWCRAHSVPLCKVVLGVVREVCAYFDARRLPDISGKHLYLYEVETQRKISFPLTIKVKGRPPLVQVGQTVLIFTCGRTSTFYTENKTYRVDFFGKVQSLCDCPMSFESPLLSMTLKTTTFTYLGR